MKLCFRTKSINNCMNELNNQSYKDYDNIQKEYKKLSIEELKKEETIIKIQKHNTELWYKRGGPSVLYLSLAAMFSCANIVITLFNVDDASVTLIILLAALVAITLISVLLQVIIFGCHCDYMEENNRNCELRLIIIKQILEDRCSAVCKSTENNINSNKER